MEINIEAPHVGIWHAITLRMVHGYGFKLASLGIPQALYAVKSRLFPSQRWRGSDPRPGSLSEGGNHVQFRDVTALQQDRDSVISPVPWPYDADHAGSIQTPLATTPPRLRKKTFHKVVGSSSGIKASLLLFVALLPWAYTFEVLSVLAANVMKTATFFRSSLASSCVYVTQVVKHQARGSLQAAPIASLRLPGSWLLLAPQERLVEQVILKPATATLNAGVI
ncbi:hypothetical protein GLOTRDRAFT_95053 [Gloeophyllum trabeum ATCC 11539]|uniref:Uncharacterized protein n=1 Tax=Gloeophyllum trabeum (strain ATCC 11539 / FP-39264 / Madison 617) TaxID=670483 RepID=S7RK47_GLOTA|nr:uncharacterized protein GLOTRDRAFT_95053 [Gloeophyllum trabeum ATCC 11539]EPQ52994.1 hypothetical protein GLOTRDRAFT_95053 [Gloeophyllum trabeum ATCC 11539]